LIRGRFELTFFEGYSFSFALIFLVSGFFPLMGVPLVNFKTGETIIAGPFIKESIFLTALFLFLGFSSLFGRRLYRKEK